MSTPFTDFDEFLDTLVQDRFMLNIFVSAVTNIRVPSIVGNFLTTSSTTSFSKSKFHGTIYL
jgi:hypothetical protein